MGSLQEDREKNQQLADKIRRKYEGSSPPSKRKKEAPSSDRSLTQWERERLRNSKIVQSIQRKHGDPKADEPIRDVSPNLDVQKSSNVAAQKEIPITDLAKADDVEEVIRKYQSQSEASKKVIVGPAGPGGPNVRTKKADWDRQQQNKNEPRVQITPVSAAIPPTSTFEKVAATEPLDIDSDIDSDIPPEIAVEKRAELRQNPEEPDIEEVDLDIDDLPEVVETQTFGTKPDKYAKIAKRLTDLYASDWFGWEPETIEFVLKREIGVDPAKHIDGVLAIAACHSSTAPYKVWNIFEKVAIALNGRVPLMNRYQALSPAEISVAVSLMRRVRPDEEWGYEVKRYVSAICHKKGLLHLTKPLDEFQEDLNKLHNMKEDAKEIAEFWESIQDTDLREFPYKENRVGIQLMRLAAIEVYRKENLDDSTN